VRCTSATPATVFRCASRARISGSAMASSAAQSISSPSATESMSSSRFRSALMLHGLDQSGQCTSDRHARGVGVRLAERDRHFFVALLQLDAGDDGVLIGGLQGLECFLVAFEALFPDGMLER